MRTSLVGAFLGAHVGLKGIPQKFVDGLEDPRPFWKMCSVLRCCFFLVVPILKTARWLWLEEQSRTTTTLSLWPCRLRNMR